jgi:hypothetical protein
MSEVCRWVSNQAWCCNCIKLPSLENSWHLQKRDWLSITPSDAFLKVTYPLKQTSQIQCEKQKDKSVVKQRGCICLGNVFPKEFYRVGEVLKFLYTRNGIRALRRPLST